jgi:putative transposase
VVLDLPLAVHTPPVIAVEQVERVLGIDWGVHTLVTTIALNAHGDQVGRPFFLDTGGFDGRQARTRRQIDQLKKRIEHLEQEVGARWEDTPKWAWLTARLLTLRTELARRWRKYARRNQALAHLASNALLLLASGQDCSLLTIESLATLKTTGRGRGVRGRWRHYRNNTQLRGAIWSLLAYKCRLHGLRLLQVPPRGTSYTCPRCGQPAQTFRSPHDRQEVVTWGRWLWCAACGYNADRDYAASINIARLGVAALTKNQSSAGARSALSLASLKPASYTGADSALRLPPTGPRPARMTRGRICYYPGWLSMVYLQSAQPQQVFLRLAG